MSAFVREWSRSQPPVYMLYPEEAIPLVFSNLPEMTTLPSAPTNAAYWKFTTIDITTGADLVEVASSREIGEHSVRIIIAPASTSIAIGSSYVVTCKVTLPGNRIWKDFIIVLVGDPSLGAAPSVEPIGEDGSYTNIPAVTAAPTAAPAPPANSVAIVYGTTDHKLFVYDGAWKGLHPT